MATMKIQTVTSRRREWRVPCNGDRNSTPYAEVCKAIASAEQELRTIKGEGVTIYDDEILIRPTDDEIIVYIELGEQVGP
jgi:hypothetical protein